MKQIAIAICIFISFAFVGCSTHKSTYSVGKDFSSENVNKIIKGTTTTSELLIMFGEPFHKMVVSESEEKWIYTYSSGTATVQRKFVAISPVQTTGQRKSLEVLVKNGLVTNFSYLDSPEPPATVKFNKE